MKSFFLTLFILFYVGCGPSAPSNNAADKDHFLVSNFTSHIIGPQVAAFSTQIADLKNEIEKACSGEARVADLKAKWKKAMMSFHYLETIAVGPLGERKRALAKHIYSWDKDSVIKPVYSQMKRAHIKDNYKFNKKRVKYKGLYALELIFFDRYGQKKFIKADDEACPYINMVGEDLDSRAKELAERWQVEVLDHFQASRNRLNYGDFIGEMAAQAQYVYHIVLHQKLNPLLGEENHEGITACEKNINEHKCIEHKFSGLMQESISQNILALHDIFSGKGQFGFIHYFEAMQKHDQAAQVSQMLEQTLEQWKVLKQGSAFSSKVTSYKSTNCANEPLCQGYIKLVDLAQWLKSDFLLLLNTELPEPVQGDND